MSLDKQIYIVGGAVRDVLLGNIPKDIDYVLVGHTPRDLEDQGMIQVGADFPVFLDADRNEYALARTERKVGIGYNGFECDFDSSVTLEQDLERRDLSINSMAVRVENWESFQVTKCINLVIDPFNGVRDLTDGVLRHTSESFAEDPVRVLRTARFAARYNFDIHPDTLELMKSIVPEINAIPGERIWMEISKGLNEQYPKIMFNVLEKCGALEQIRLLPYSTWNRSALGRATNYPIKVKFATIARNFKYGDYYTLSIPNEFKRVSHSFNTTFASLCHYDELIPDEKLNLITNLGALKNDYLLDPVLMTFELFVPAIANSVIPLIKNDVELIRGINDSEIASQYTNGQDIKKALYDARIYCLLNQIPY